MPQNVLSLMPQGAESAAAGLDGLLTAALDHAPVGLIVLDANRRVRLVTGNAATLLGCGDAAALQGMSAMEMPAGCLALHRDSRAVLRAALSGDIGDAAEIRLTAASLTGMRSLSADIRPAGTHGWVLSLEDVTSTCQTQDFLLEHASSDPVTGLWNRQHFLLMLHDRLTAGNPARIARAAAPAVLLIGLQRLKQVNDTLGVDAGDTLLRQVADRLISQTQDQDMLARLSGDEFALFLDRAGDRPAVASIASLLLACLAEPFPIDGQPVALGAHVGIACVPEDGETADTLLANAGLALLETTRRGVAPVRFFDPALTEQANLRRALEADLRLALERGEFELHYQPQVDVYRCCVTGLEALIRWRSPQRGLVPPVEFIALAEQMGLINDIGDWVLREACREAARWPADVTVAVNASPLQFETGRFARTVADALAESGLEAGRLEVEITESLLLRDTGTVMATLAALHAMGVRLVLDDFGTGYASLSQLSRFRFDKIKIDRSFVSPIDTSVENSAIVRSIAALGHSLGIPTTAEGVETARQLEQIKADGCTCVQGYFFSRPVPSGDVDGLLGRLHRPYEFEVA